MIADQQNQGVQQTVQVSAKEKTRSRLHVGQDTAISHHGKTCSTEMKSDWPSRRLVALLGKRFGRFSERPFHARLARHEPYDEG